MLHEIRLKVDESLPTRLCEVFSTVGFACQTVKSQGWLGMPDEDLFPRVLRAGEILVTADREFGDVRKFPVGTHHGIIFLRLKEESGEAYVALCRFLLEDRDLSEVVGHICVVTQWKSRLL